MKTHWIFALLALMLFIGGCAAETTTTSGAFVGGTQGLVAVFAPQNPPQEIFDRGQFPFSVIVEVENVGEYNIEERDGYIELSGIDPNQYGSSFSAFSQEIPALEATRKTSTGTIIRGIRDVVAFPELNYEGTVAGRQGPFPLRANLCYNYETRAVANICIREDTVDGLSRNELCRINEVKKVSNSGAPIHVKQVQQSSRGRDGVSVAITIGSVGKSTDRFFKHNTECRDSASNQDKYVVHVEVDPINNGQIQPQCTLLSNGNSGDLKLFGGQDRTFTCTFDTSSIQGEFETLLNIKLSYRYSEIIDTQFFIQEVSS